MLQQSHTPLTNGIMSFMEASEDHELAPIGIGSMHEQAQKLAEYGRHGDIYFVHAAEGETVVPMEVLNANPKVKDMLFNQMREMGLDPDEFVVGNELNSINPVTGMPEFFFSSVWRGVKKAASSVWQGVRKAAPYVIPLVLSYFGVPGAAAGSMFGAGSFGAAFLGGGIGSLAAGKSWKESLRNAAMAGGTAAVWSGIGNIGGQGGFTGGVGRSLGMTPTGGFSLYGADPGASYMDIKTDYTGAYPSEMAGPPDNRLNYPSRAPVAGPARPTAMRLPPPQTPSVPGGAGHYMATRGGTAGQFGGGPPIGTNPSARIPLPSVAQGPSMPPTAGRLPSKFIQPPKVEVPPSQQRFSDQLRHSLRARMSEAELAAAKAAKLKEGKELGIVDTLKGWGKTASDFVTGGKPTSADLIKEANRLMATAPSGTLTFSSALKLATQDLTPGPLRTYGPTLAAAGLGYMFFGDDDPAKKAEQERLAREDEARKKYERDYARYDRNPGDYYVDLGLPRRQQQSRSSMFGAQGGLAEYPRRDLLVEGPGTERSDDIPAMLSDGEFVMNSKSVRGADPSGRGNRYAGANNLYNMMRNFEMRT